MNIHIQIVAWRTEICEEDWLSFWFCFLYSCDLCFCRLLLFFYLFIYLMCTRHSLFLYLLWWHMILFCRLYLVQLFNSHVHCHLFVIQKDTNLFHRLLDTGKMRRFSEEVNYTSRWNCTLMSIVQHNNGIN